jgi:hypothetical protein
MHKALDKIINFLLLQQLLLQLVAGSPVFA